MASKEQIKLPNNLVQPLLTDLYQITMAYAYWKNGKRDDQAVFDLFFRRNPFRGEFTVFAGLEQCVGLLQRFSFSESGVCFFPPLHLEVLNTCNRQWAKNLNSKKASSHVAQKYFLSNASSIIEWI